MDLDTSIRQRKTVKVLAHAEPLPASEPRLELGSGPLAEVLELAGWAPFHRACDECHRQDTLGGIEPWRFHVLLAEDCRKLVHQITSEQAGKIPAMLSAADALILATWLPNPPSGEFQVTDQHPYEPTLANMEHIAAASAAVQNLLLAATSRGMSNYWSSGGVLRTQVMGEIGISAQEILIGALFLFPTETGSAEVVGSKLRDKRTPPVSWCRHLEVE